MSQKNNPDFRLDVKSFDDTINKKILKVSTKELHNSFVKVAWDLVRFRDDDDAAKLWKVESSDDGDYILALYQEEDQVKTAGPNSHWKISLNKLSNVLEFHYKNDPIINITAAKLGLEASDLAKAIQYLPSKLASNGKLTQSLLKELPENKKNLVLNKYPELKQG